MRNSFLLVLLVTTLSCKKSSESNKEPIAQNQHSTEMKKSISRGAEIYNNFCASCHLSGGEGINGVFPPLNESDWLTEKRTASIHAIKFGLQGPIEVNGEDYDNLMPQLGLTDQEIVDVMNYINNSWSNSIPEPVTLEEVTAIAK